MKPMPIPDDLKKYWMKVRHNKPLVLFLLMCSEDEANIRINVNEAFNEIIGWYLEKEGE